MGAYRVMVAALLIAGLALSAAGLCILLMWDSHRKLMSAYDALADRVHYLETAQMIRDRHMWSKETLRLINAQVVDARERQRSLS